MSSRPLHTIPAAAVARAEKETFEIVSATLSGLYRNLHRCELYVAHHGELVRVASTGDAPPNEEESLKRLSARLVATGGEGIAAEAHLFSGNHALGQGSLMSALLLDGRSLAGLIVVEATAGTRDFTLPDLEALKGVAALCSLALRRARTLPNDRLDESLELDRKIARRVQRRLMRKDLPADAGVVVASSYQPALDVGGDFYELAYLGEGKVGGVIGDVSGKGVAAALVMARVSSDVERALRSGDDPSTVLKRVNESLPDLGHETFVTASCIRIDARHRTLTVANAGHIPLLIRKASGEVMTAGLASGIPLGIMPCDYFDQVVGLELGDIVLLMTDGLVEAFDSPDDRMGTEYLVQLVKRSPHEPKVIVERILEAANETRDVRQLDDVTLLAMQLVG